MLLTTVVLLASCAKEGQIKSQPSTTYLINGKTFKFVSIIPADGVESVWILVPLDSSTTVPLVSKYSYTVHSKNHTSTYNVNAIQIQ